MGRCQLVDYKMFETGSGAMVTTQNMKQIVLYVNSSLREVHKLFHHTPRRRLGGEEV
jgi:hypothetical protein